MLLTNYVTDNAQYVTYKQGNYNRLRY